ncbi:hypothetical protein I6F66_02760 [Pseudoalteromonas sp. NZS100_1]|uniref:hypothetical protein n=1 Tax=Pseudoalteromonas sp. NZS100_1 TaxID=2792073 RepID=UPI0018CE4842|nr:hypothetical protein [Pseudoalteromonas sp. NZS100_1]MBH0010993.1 hypothetical protein [Pseudoalteromonas sp. NZS100_1]
MTEQSVQVSEKQLLDLLNLQLRSHPEYIEGMSFDSINILPNNQYDIRANFNFGEKTTAVNYNTKGHVYNEVFGNFLK